MSKEPPKKPSQTTRTITLTTSSKKSYEKQLQLYGDGKVGHELYHLIKSRYRILYVRSPEERRVISAFKLISFAGGYDLYQWDCSRGMLDAMTMERVTSDGNEVNKADAEAALHYIIDAAKSLASTTKANQGSIFMLLDFHHFLDNTRSHTEVIERLFKEFGGLNAACYIVIVSPLFMAPASLDKEFTLVDMPPPSRAEVKVSFDKMCKNIPAGFPKALEAARDHREELLQSTTGLTIKEAEDAYAKSLVSKGTFDIPTILEEKKQIIRKSGILDYRDSKFSFDQIGGLDLLKEWLITRRLAFKDDAKEFGLDSPKGVLLTGIPGCVLGDTKIRVKKISDEGEHKIFVE